MVIGNEQRERDDDHNQLMCFAPLENLLRRVKQHKKINKGIFKFDLMTTV